MTKRPIGPKVRKPRSAAWMFGVVLAALPVAALQASEHGAHTHGVSQLDVALSGEELKLTLTVPGADVVGFEHAPQSAQDKAAVKAATAKLENASALFTLPGAARCRIEKVEVRAGGLGGGHDEHGQDAGQMHRGDLGRAEEEHGHGPHEESSQEAKRHGSGDPHMEFEGHYQFHCAQPDRLDAMMVGVFAAFPSIGRINARVLTPRGQSAQPLTATSPRLGL